MQKEDNDTSVTNEDTEILNLPLYTERKADGIYRYRRRVPKPLVSRIVKGYLYRNLGKTKQGFRVIQNTNIGLHWRNVII